ncbi:MbeB family mobilization protein [Klebsiella pneumoniae]|uniref:MbeB family mobilization protein n=1 Tax=Klebsiella pneumoniae TaxID=573 RepID=UPI003F90E623
MNSLLTLAKDLEQKSKAQQQSTGEMLKAAFSEHEKSVRAELSESGKRISAAIRAHEQGMSAAMQSNRLSVMRMVGLLFASLSGVLWYQGSLIASNLAEIDRQNAALSKLNAKTWGVTYLEDSNGRFLVLPKGTAVDRTQSWTVGNGRSKQNALRLVKE